MYTNIDTLTTDKKAALEAEIFKSKPDIICINEVCPKNFVYALQEESLSLTGYNLFHQGLNNRGVCVYVANHLNATLLDPKVAFVESVWVEINVNLEKLILGCIYRSPSCSDENNHKLLELLDEMANLPHDQFIVVGDFNYKEIDWKTRSCNCRNNHPAYKMFDKLNDLFLTQFQHEASRYRENETPSCLDWIISANDDDIENIRINPPILSSDHVVLEFSAALKVNRAQNNEHYCFYRGDYDLMRDDLSNIDWPAKLNGNAQQAWDSFNSYILGLIEKYIPKRRYLSHISPPWLSRDIKNQIKAKHRAWDVFKRNKSNENWTKYKQCRNIVANSIPKAKTNFEEKIVSEIKSNPKNFWKYVKQRTKPISGIQSLEDNDGLMVTDDQIKAEILNNYFASVFTVENIDDLPSDDDIPPSCKNKNIPTLEDIEFDESTILKLLEQINISKAAGPDGLHARVLKECRESFAVALNILFRLFLDEGCLPYQWKMADVKPLFKKGKKHQRANYRPVSLTSICCKLQEKLIRNAIVLHLETHGLLCCDQHGFRCGRSCCTQLLEIMEIWSGWVDQDLPWDCIYLDFAKAFDSVPHERLLFKAQSYGISGKILKWVKDFLHDRKQRVIVNEAKSSWEYVKSGIPQGSVLGPILFLIFINDLPDWVQSLTKVFADDTKVFRTIQTTNDSEALQEDLASLARWSAKWQLPFNTSKCKCIHYGKNNPSHTYKMSNHDLEVVQEEKDLGVTFDSKLNFSSHIRNIVNKANSRVGLIKRTFQSLDKVKFTILYKSLVRPILEYCTQIWAPVLKGDQDEIEKVQRRATKLVIGLSEKTYPERLKHLNLTTLAFRRKRCDIIQVFRIIHSIDSIDQNLFFKIDPDRRTRGNSFKIFKPRVTSRLRQNSFSQRVINIWNDLPDDVVSQVTLNSFKGALERFWKNDPQKFDPNLPWPQPPSVDPGH